MINTKYLFKSKIKHPYVALIVLLLITFLIAYGRYIWGGDYYIYTDAGSDCADQYYPTYIYLIRKIQEGGLSLWNHSCGLGMDTLTNQTWIMDPFAVLIIIVGVTLGTQTVAVMLVITQFLKVLISALLAYRFLNSFGIRDEIKVITAYLYGYNSFLIIWGQHYWFGAISIYILILLIVLEAWLADVYNPSKYMLEYSMAIAFSFCYSLYLTYMSLIMVTIYACLRFAYMCNKSGKELFYDVLKNGIRICLATLLGILLSSVMIFPFIDNNLIISSRVSTESMGQRIIDYLIHPYELIYYYQLFLRMISSNVIGISSSGASYYGIPMLTISVVGLIYEAEGVLYVKNQLQNIKAKIVFGIGLFLIAFLLFVPLGSCIFNAFQYPFGRYTFILMPVITIFIALGLQRICVEKKAHYILLGTVLLVEIVMLVLGAYIFDNTPLVRIFIKFVIVLNIFSYIFIIIYTKKNKKWAIGLLFICIISGCIAETYMASSSKERVTEDGLHIENRLRTENAVNWLEKTDKSYFRIDKSYNDFEFLADSMIEQIHTVTDYNSVINENLAQFYKNIWPEVMTDEICKVTSSRGYILDKTNLRNDNVLALLGVKYILTDQDWGDLGSRWKKLDYEENGLAIYQNMQADSIVTGYTKVLTEDKFEKYPNPKRKEIIKSYLIMDQSETEKNGIDTCNVDETNLQDAHFDNNYDLKLVKDTYFKGEMDIDHDKYLLTAIPYRKGWNVYIDGNKVPVYKGDYGFIAFQISEGDHLVEIKYENMIYVIGCLLSVLGIIIWIILYKTNILDRLFMKKEKM